MNSREGRCLVTREIRFAPFLTVGLLPRWVELC
jgi:hypothetical protein